MKIQLSDHFSYRKLMRFVLPSIVMMICTSVYSIVDGLFVSNLVGKTPFAALNLIYPALMMLSTVGFMIGTGGSAVVAKTFGEGNNEKANEYFSMLICVTVILSVVLSVLGYVYMRPIAYALGSDEAMIEHCVIYGRILCVSLVAFVLQCCFQSFFIVAEKPGLNLKISIVAGLTNVVLDWLFIAVFRWGIAGAALATAAGQIIGGASPVIYFSRHNNSILKFVKPVFNIRVILKACTNGASEMLTNLSMSLVNVLYNFQLIKIAGENGIAAYGTIMYVNFIFVAIFIGFSFGTAPVISYHFGAGNTDELKNLFRKCLVIMGVSGIALTVLAELLAYPLTAVFVGYDTELLEMTLRGFCICSIAFLISGFNVFGSSFFTALNNGLVSGVISFFRTLVFQIAAIAVLPIVLGIDGIWLAVTFAELMALVVTVTFFVTQRKKYNYV